ncbi:MAG: membrane protein insertase YidC [Alphaproteobacteria bacterium]|nr:membrane protein insertase YidC [Alphaproteobacteria bacterium]
MVKYLDNKSSGFRQWNAARDGADKKSWLSSFLWWFAIFVACWWLIGLWMRPATDKNNVTDETVTAIDVSSVPVSEISGEKITYDVRGLRISNVALNDFDATAADNAHVVLLPAAQGAFTEVGLISQNTLVPAADTTWNVSGDDMVWKNKSGVEFRRNIATDGYVITISDTVKNNSAAAIAVAPYARMVRSDADTATAGVYTGPIAYANNDLEHESWRSLNKKSYAYTTTNGFVGFADQYWETVVAVERPDQTMRAKKIANMYETDTAAAAVSIAPGTDATIISHIFAGPRDQSVLNTAADKIAGINKTVDYGWFWFLARPMLWILNAIHSVVMNYGIAIIIMTILLRLLMWPLTRKSYTSMVAMQKMQPEIARIQKLYANDKARMQMEMMRVYQSNKTSPMSGCLPMLLQIPIFFALYKALLISVPMRGAHFLWIRDLAAMDPYFILPVLMGATMWLQSYLQTPKNTATGNDAVAQSMRMMKWMPVLFTILFAWMPAGLVLYWTVSNLFGIGQMWLIKKRTVK